MSGDQTRSGRYEPHVSIPGCCFHGVPAKDSLSWYDKRPNDGIVGDLVAFCLYSSLALNFAAQPFFFGFTEFPRGVLCE